MTVLVNLLWLDEIRGRSTAEAAPIYAANGVAILPCHDVTSGHCSCGNRECSNPGKHPRTPNGVHDATTDVKQVREWWRRNPNANIGGTPQLNHFALDVDGEAGVASLRQLEREYSPLPMTTRQVRGINEHQLFEHPSDVKVGQRVKFRPGLDTRASGRGYIILAPSLHHTGMRYEWRATVAVAMAPAWLLDLVRVKPEPERKPYTPPTGGHPAILDRRRKYAVAVLGGEARAVAEASEGGRNDRLNKAWWRILQFRDVVPESEARAELERAATACGLPEREIAKVLR